MGGPAHPPYGHLMRAALAWCWARLGWRGLTLLITGVSWVTYGASLTVQPRYGTVRGISVLLGLVPMPVWGWGWIGCGVIALVYAVARPGRDLPGVAASVAPPLLWSLAYALGGAAGASGTAWGAVMPWGSHAILIAIVAYLTRPRLIVPKVVRHGDE
ncbi:hypothetical protein B1H20_17065 [Streptomyces violaceoruber]|uniref:Integral membrane protein n=2 Tax=Streptomyces violaceoruber TaxID=1935 RepID=A0A1V0UD66_STRVN|nr:hypothetical protein B1H20_17065 [Streptomyces violaceoruber]